MEYVADGGEVYDKFHPDIVVCMIGGSLHVKNTKTKDAHPFVPNEVDIHREWKKKETEESKTGSDAILDALARNMEKPIFRVYEDYRSLSSVEYISLTIHATKRSASKEDWDAIVELCSHYHKLKEKEN